ncbi:cAMP-binding protein [Leucobacter weissii]|uniref:cAMP-binding protein n=1 Tax=Leucobacter weissii TaxID=1983706 RepID=A0A939MH89_9MICO|nr:cAMP-binding protein [Leucobacter weissii]MBO1900884.1 cAMP-binding protein [Leucobacter weissii]
MSTDWYAAPESYEIPASWGLEDEDREILRDSAWSLILKGENDPAEFVALFEDELAEAGVAEERALAFFASAIELRRRQQDELGGPPESRLSRAFAELAEIGVLGREDFTCCGTCGSAEIWDERDDSRVWRGYLYYHTQDAERIPEDRSTYVGYGAFLDAHLPEDEWNALNEEQQDERYERIVTGLMVDEVFPVLERHGIEVSWNRDLGTRILLSNVDLFVAV